VRRRGLLAGALAGGALAAARAQGPVPGPAGEPGQVHGSAYFPLPAGLAFGVRALDDTPVNLRLARQLAAALRRRGRAVQGPPAPLMVSLETEIQQVPNRDRRYPSDSRGPVRYVLTVTVDESGRRLWNGEASYVGGPNDEAQILLQLVEVIADEIGITSRPHGFSLE
jgi:hypothetical protein